LSINKLHPLPFFYLLFCLELLIIGGLSVWGKSFVKGISIRKTILSLIFLKMIFFMSLQQIGRMTHWESQLSRMLTQTEFKREELFFGEIFVFAELAKHYLPGRHQADFQTDRDCTIDPCMKMHRALRNLLYPEISVGYNNQAPKDSIIFFYKNDYLNHIPEGYEDILSVNRTHLITKKP